MKTKEHDIVVRVARVVTSLSCRAVRPTNATLHGTTFSCAKMHGLFCVSCHVVTWRNKWNLGFITQVTNINVPACDKKSTAGVFSAYSQRSKINTVRRL